MVDKVKSPLSSFRIRQENVTIKSSERVFIAGKTGSGKTTLAETILMTVPRLVVIDSKDGLQSWKLENFTKSHIRDLENGKPVRTRIVDDGEALRVLEIAYNSGNVVIYLDEVTAFIPNPSPQSIPQVIKNIWQRGRSKGIGAWATSQQPVSIPLSFIREAEHFFVFRLNMIDDRKRFRFMGDRVLEPIPDKYGFYYYNTDAGRIRYYSRLRI